MKNIVGKIGWFFTYVSLLDGYDIKSFTRLVDCRQHILLRQLFQIWIFSGSIPQACRMDFMEMMRFIFKLACLAPWLD